MENPKPSRWTLLKHYRDYGAGMGPNWHRLRARMARHGATAGGQRILEIGAGEFYPYAMLFGSAGQWIVGTDIAPLAWAGVTAGRYRRFRRESGVVRGAARWGFNLCVQAAYYRALGRSAGVRLHPRTPRLVCQDAEKIAFRDATFDLCISSAAFEHIADVPAAVAEIARVLRPGGLADIEVHLFPSLTGGHEFELSHHRPPRPGFPVWGHLFDPAWRPSVPLNRWREAQYRTAFSAHFDVVDRIVESTHGEPYLNDEVLARVPGYSREELLTESVIFVLRRKDVSPAAGPMP